MSDMMSESIEYLAPDEKILWQGQSKSSSSAALAVRPIMLAAVATLGVGLMLVYVGAPHSVLNLWGIGLPWSLLLIILFAFGPVIAMLAWRGRQDRQTQYLVTTSAAIIVGASSRASQRATILPLRNLTAIKVSRNRDGTGTLHFNFSPRDAAANDLFVESTLAFLNIEQPLMVYQLIRQQMGKV
ncbi:MAG: hypothetical protein U0559_18250 [Anaerolineae bacterium]